METIGAYEAKTRLGELLGRAEQGESFEITKHGRIVGRLVPPENTWDREASAAAAERLIELGRSIRAHQIQQGMAPLTQEEIKAMIHEGHRY